MDSDETYKPSEESSSLTESSPASSTQFSRSHHKRRKKKSKKTHKHKAPSEKVSDDPPARTLESTLPKRPLKKRTQVETQDSTDTRRSGQSAPEKPHQSLMGGNLVSHERPLPQKKVRLSTTKKTADRCSTPEQPRQRKRKLFTHETPPDKKRRLSTVEPPSQNNEQPPEPVPVRTKEVKPSRRYRILKSARELKGKIKTKPHPQNEQIIILKPGLGEIPVELPRQRRPRTKPRKRPKDIKTHRRPRKECLKCGLPVVHLPRHLVDTHGFTPEAAFEYTVKNRGRWDDNPDLRVCPMRGCPSVVTRIRLHLIRYHGLHRHLAVVLQSLAQPPRYSSDTSDAEDVPLTKGPQQESIHVPKQPAETVTHAEEGAKAEESKASESERDQSEESEASTESSQSIAFDGQHEVIPVEDVPSGIGLSPAPSDSPEEEEDWPKVWRDHILLSQFVRWQTTIEKNRTQREAQSHASRVMTIWRTLGNTTDLELLTNVDLVRDKFLEDFRRDRPPTTVKVYMQSLKDFISYCLTEDILNSERASKISNALTRWCASLRKETSKRRFEIKVRAVTHAISAGDISAFMTSNSTTRAIEYLERFKIGDSDFSIKKGVYCLVRNFIILHTLISNGQRVGAIEHLTMGSVRNSIIKDGDHVCYVLKHKTDYKGAARLVFDQKSWTWIQTYCKLRPTIPKFHEKLLRPDAKVFLTWPTKGCSCQEMDQRVIRASMQNIWQEAGVTSEKVTATKLRQMTVTHVRQVHPDQRESLATHMTHQPSTADVYYQLHEDTDTSVRVCKLIRSIFTGESDETNRRQSGEDDNHSSENVIECAPKPNPDDNGSKETDINSPNNKSECTESPGIHTDFQGQPTESSPASNAPLIPLFPEFYADDPYNPANVLPMDLEPELPRFQPLLPPTKEKAKKLPGEKKAKQPEIKTRRQSAEDDNHSSENVIECAPKPNPDDNGSKETDINSPNNQSECTESPGIQTELQDQPTESSPTSNAPLIPLFPEFDADDPYNPANFLPMDLEPELPRFQPLLPPTEEKAKKLPSEEKAKQPEIKTRPTVCLERPERTLTRHESSRQKRKPKSSVRQQELAGYSSSKMGEESIKAHGRRAFTREDAEWLLKFFHNVIKDGKQIKQDTIVAMLKQCKEGQKLWEKYFGMFGKAAGKKIADRLRTEIRKRSSD